MAKTNLTKEQREAVVELAHMPGWPILLDALQARIDYIGDELGRAMVPDLILRLQSKWQALREVAHILRSTPVLLLNELKEEAKDAPPGPEQEPAPEVKAHVMQVLRTMQALREGPPKDAHLGGIESE